MEDVPNDILIEMLRQAGLLENSIEAIVCMSPDGKSEIIYIKEGVEESLVNETEEFLKSQND